MKVIVWFKLKEFSWQGVVNDLATKVKASTIIYDVTANELTLITRIDGYPGELARLCDELGKWAYDNGFEPRVTVETDDQDIPCLVFKFFEKIEHEEDFEEV